MKLAVIGSGVAGLTAAYRLREDYELVLFEAAERPGGHAHTVDVRAGGLDYAVDTGFIVYNERTYPGFIALLDELGIQGQNTEMSFSVSCEASGLEYSSRGLRGLFAQPQQMASPAHWWMLGEILRFNRLARELVGGGGSRTLGEFVDAQGFSRRFQRHYLYPMCAAIWSGSLEDSAQFPAAHFAEFFHNHGLLTVTGHPQWKTVPGGSREYVGRIAGRLGKRLRLATPVTSVRREGGGVSVESAAGRERFDEVLFACHSDQALRLLADPSEREREILGALPYRDNEAILHTDDRLLPRQRHAWASWNYRIARDPSALPTLTYHMNRLQKLAAPVELCVTLNQTALIAPEAILGRYRYAHPVYTLASNAARARRQEISGQRHTHYCGAYWYNGFHEDGLRSAMDVVRQLSRPALAA